MIKLNQKIIRKIEGIETIQFDSENNRDLIDREEVLKILRSLLFKSSRIDLNSSKYLNNYGVKNE